jgi:dephospho-CoA kinase
MKVIGITGGVGCGKSTVLNFLEEKYNCRILKSDDAARILEEPGGECYTPMVRMLEEASLPGDGELLPEGPGTPFDRKEAAVRLYRSAELRDKIDGIVHPAVIRYIKDQIRTEKESQKHDFFFIEAALLIENGFGRIVDEMWYIYCPEAIRRQRLKESRGYSDEKIDSIMRAQLSEEEFRKGSDFVIDNGGTPEETKKQIREHIGKMSVFPERKPSNHWQRWIWDFLTSTEFSSHMNTRTTSQGCV